MKTLKFFFVVIGLLAMSLQGFSQATPVYETNTSTHKVYYCLDTVSNSTAVTFSYPYTIPAGWQYSIQVVADSLSGSTAGTIYLKETSSVGSSAVYSTVSSGTQTVDGLQTIKTFTQTTQFTGSKLQVYVTGGGTQSTKVRVWFCLKKMPTY